LRSGDAPDLTRDRNDRFELLALIGFGDLVAFDHAGEAALAAERAAFEGDEAGALSRRRLRASCHRPCIKNGQGARAEALRREACLFEEAQHESRRPPAGHAAFIAIGNRRACSLSPQSLSPQSLRMAFRRDLAYRRFRKS